MVTLIFLACLGVLGRAFGPCPLTSACVGSGAEVHEAGRTKISRDISTACVDHVAATYKRSKDGSLQLHQWHQDGRLLILVDSLVLCPS